MKISRLDSLWKSQDLLCCWRMEGAMGRLNCQGPYLAPGRDCLPVGYHRPEAMRGHGADLMEIETVLAVVHCLMLQCRGGSHLRCLRVLVQRTGQLVSGDGCNHQTGTPCFLRFEDDGHVSGQFWYNGRDHLELVAILSKPVEPNEGWKLSGGSIERSRSTYLHNDG